VPNSLTYPTLRIAANRSTGIDKVIVLWDIVCCLLFVVCFYTMGGFRMVDFNRSDESGVPIGPENWTLLESTQKLALWQQNDDKTLCVATRRGYVLIMCKEMKIAQWAIQSFQKMIDSDSQ
jgi:hypothetical protein